MDRVWCDLEFDLNKFKCLSLNRRRTKILRGKPSGVGRSLGALNHKVPLTDEDIGETWEKEKPIVPEEIDLALEPFGEDFLSEPHRMIQSTLLTKNQISL